MISYKMAKKRQILSPWRRKMKFLVGFHQAILWPSTTPFLSYTVRIMATSLKGASSGDDSSLSLSMLLIVDVVITKIGSTISMAVAGLFFGLCYKWDALVVSFSRSNFQCNFWKVLEEGSKKTTPSQILLLCTTTKAWTQCLNFSYWCADG